MSESSGTASEAEEKDDIQNKLFGGNINGKFFLSKLFHPNELEQLIAINEFENDDICTRAAWDVMRSKFYPDNKKKFNNKTHDDNEIHQDFCDFITFVGKYHRHVNKFRINNNSESGTGTGSELGTGKELTETAATGATSGEPATSGEQATSEASEDDKDEDDKGEDESYEDARGEDEGDANANTDANESLFSLMFRWFAGEVPTEEDYAEGMNETLEGESADKQKFKIMYDKQSESNKLIIMNFVTKLMTKKDTEIVFRTNEEGIPLFINIIPKIPKICRGFYVTRGDKIEYIQSTVDGLGLRELYKKAYTTKDYGNHYQENSLSEKWGFDFDKLRNERLLLGNTVKPMKTMEYAQDPYYMSLINSKIYKFEDGVYKKCDENGDTCKIFENKKDDNCYGTRIQGDVNKKLNCDSFTSFMEDIDIDPTIPFDFKNYIGEVKQNIDKLDPRIAHRILERFHFQQISYNGETGFESVDAWKNANFRGARHADRIKGNKNLLEYLRVISNYANIHKKSIKDYNDAIGSSGPGIKPSSSVPSSSKLLTIKDRVESTFSNPLKIILERGTVSGETISIMPRLSHVGGFKNAGPIIGTQRGGVHDMVPPFLKIKPRVTPVNFPVSEPLDLKGRILKMDTTEPTSENVSILRTIYNDQISEFKRKGNDIAQRDKSYIDTLFEEYDALIDEFKQKLKILYDLEQTLDEVEDANAAGSEKAKKKVRFDDEKIDVKNVGTRLVQVEEEIAENLAKNLAVENRENMFNKS